MEDERQQQTGVSAVGDVGKDHLLYGDLLGEEFTSGPAAHEENCLPDTLIVFDDEFSDPYHTPQGVTTEGVLLDLGDGSGGGSSIVERRSLGEQQASGSVDLLGDSNGPFDQSVMNIPPPMEFSDPFHQPRLDSSNYAENYSTPVTNIDDLLGLDFLTGLDPASDGGEDSEPFKISTGTQGGSSGDGFVLLPDLQGPLEQLSSETTGDDDTRCPLLPCETSFSPSSVPPPIPTDPPPDPPYDPSSLTSVGVVDASSDHVTVHSSSPDSDDLDVEVLSSSDAQTLSLASVSGDSIPADEPEHPPDPPADESPVLSEESSQLPIVDPSSAISENDPPALPVDPPSLVSAEPVASVPAHSSAIVETADTNDRSGQSKTTLKASNTTTLFLPSPNPADNVTLISVTPTDSEQNNSSSNNNTIHITDITVTSPSSNTSSVVVTNPKPSLQGTESQKGGAVSGAAVVLVDNSSLPSATHIQFDNSTQETVMKSTLPPDAFMPTSVGVTRTLKPSAEKDDEEEEITPMMVHRDHQGNTMAAPSPPETLGRQTTGPRKLDQDAKRDLQVVLSRMTEVSRASATKRERAEDGTVVQEEDIVPVKLTRQEAGMAQDVVSRWLNQDTESPLSSPPPSRHKSGFQKVVGAVLNIQSGKDPLPDNCTFLTTMGVTASSSGQNAGKQQEEEDQIVPMSLHKDHLGNKHYAPSPPESLGKQSGRRQLDSAAKQDIADLMSGMTSKTRIVISSEQTQVENDVTEEPIVATMLTREQSRMAQEAISRWQDAEKQTPRPRPSPFQRLVENVMDTTDKTNQEQTVCSTDQIDHPNTQTDPLQDHGSNSDNTSTAELMEASVSHSVHQASAASAPGLTPPEPPKQVSSQAYVSSTDTKPTSTQNARQPAAATAAAAGGSTAPGPSHQNCAVKTESAPRATRIVIENRSAKAIQPADSRSSKGAAATPPGETKPQSSQKSVRAPAKITSLSQTSSSSSPKPLSRLGGVSATTRPPVLPLSSTRLSSRGDYAKTRTDESPFLVEVLKGIVGLGIKVKVNGEGHVEVTEVQRNSPVDKNGNVRVGDYVLSINTTELRGLTDGRVQQVLRLLPRGLVKLIVTTRPPPSLVQGTDISEQASSKAGGAYSQFGVRLSPRPFDPSLDRPSPGLTSPPVIQDQGPCLAQALTTTATDHLSPAVVTRHVSSTSPVCPAVSQSSSSTSLTASSTSNGSPDSKSPSGSSLREDVSSAHAPSEKGKVTSRVQASEKETVSPAQHTLISSSSEIAAGSGTIRPREEDTVVIPQQVGSPTSTDTDTRLSPSAECPADTGPDGQTVHFSAPSLKELPSVPVHEGLVETEVDDMENRKLSTALSPRIRSAQSHHSEQASQPKPAPRQRISIPPPSLPAERKGTGEGGAGDHGPGSPQRGERHLSPSEIVTAASRRPSGRGDDDLSSPPTSPGNEVTKKERSKFLRDSREFSPSVGPEKTVRNTTRVNSPMEETAPPDSASLPKRSPVPTPRHRSRLPEETTNNRVNRDYSPKQERQTFIEADPQHHATEGNTGAVVHAHMVTILPESAASPPEPQQSKDSPTVARRTRQRVHSDNLSKEVPCPTLVSARLRAFADPNVPTLEDQAQNRRFVSSAARMFEQKASEGGSSSVFSKPTKSAVSVSSVVKSLNSQDTDSFNRSGVTMRKKSLGVGARTDRESSDLSAKERRKSMPSSLVGSSLSLSSNLSHVKNLSASTATLHSHDQERDDHHRLNSALSPRQGRSNTTSLKSVIGSRDFNEGRRPHSPPSVGKSSDSKRASLFTDVTLRSRSSVHDRHNVTSQSNRKSWSPHTDDSVSYQVSTSLARRRAERLGASLSYSMSSLVSDEQPRKVDSAVRRFDDLLSYRHTLDDELPKVSNSLSLDFHSRRTDRTKDVKDTARQPARAIEVDKKTEDHSWGEREIRRKTAEQSWGRTEVVKTDVRPLEGRTRENKKPTDMSVSEPLSQPLSPSPVLPSCLKTPDEFVMEERQTFTFNESDVRAKDRSVTSPKPTTPPPDVGQEMEKPQLAETNGTVHEAVVGFIVAQGQRQQMKDGQIGTNKDTANDHHTEDNTGFVHAQHSDRHSQLVTRGETPKKERDQSVKSEVHETGDVTSGGLQQDRSASKRDMMELEDVYPEQDAPMDTRNLGDLNHPENVKSRSQHVTDTNFMKETAPVEHAVSQEVPHRHVRDPEENEHLEEDEDDSPPPPLPDEGPPPLPGAPPPPLALSSDVELLVDVEDLEGMLPSQETPSPDQEVDASEAPQQHRVSANVEKDADTMAPGVIASTFDTPLQQTVTAPTSSPNYEQKPAQDVGLLPFHPSSPPPHQTHPPPPAETDVLNEMEFPGKEGEEHGHDNPPVSDTLSQDSGVQDEDMSEDGLRLSMDDSPTSTSMFDAAITPDDVPASVLGESTESQATEGQVANSGVTEGHVAKSGVTEGQVAKSGVTEGQVAKTGVTEDQVTETRVTDGQVAKSGVVEDQVAKSGVTEGQVANSGVTEGQVAKSGVTEGQVTETRVRDGQVAKSGVTEGHVAKSGITEGQVTENRVKEGQVTGTRVTKGQVTETRVTKGQVIENRVTKGQVTKNRVTKGQVTENWVTGDQVTEGSVTDSQTAKSEINVESRAQTVSHKPVASTRRTVLHASASPVSPSTPTHHTGPESTLVGVSQAAVVAPNPNRSAPQGSASPRCSSDQEEVETPASHGGVSTTGEAVTAEDSPQAVQLSTDTPAVDHHHQQEKISAETENNVRKKEFRDKKNDKPRTVPREKQEKVRANRATDSHSQEETTTRALPKTSEDDQEDHLGEEPSDAQADDASAECVQVSSSRKWCILDQSGSLFMQGAGSTPVEVHRAMLRQVSSLQPVELAEAVRAANRDLDGAKLPLTLELRLVSARELGGEIVHVDVAQREDYFVQVTKVHSPGSSLQEADLLLSVDGHSLRHRRPAQVHTQLDNTGPKGVLLTARGLKLPLSVATALAAAATDEANKPERKSSPSASAPAPSSPRTPTGTPTKAVQVGPGVYDVTLTKGPAGVGFSLEGGMASPRGDMPIVIKRIFKGGPADKGGALKVKDTILSVNGVDFTTMSHYDAWNQLKAIQDGQITLRIRREE